MLNTTELQMKGGLKVKGQVEEGKGKVEIILSSLNVDADVREPFSGACLLLVTSASAMMYMNK